MYPLVLVTYADAWSDDDFNLPHPWRDDWLVTLSGFLVRETRTVISVAQEVHPNGSFRAVTHVMRRMVKSLEIVREGEG